MRLFYTAVTDNGRRLRGVLDARSESDVAVYLRRQNLTPIKIRRQGVHSLVSLPFLKKRFSDMDLLFFTSQLASMLESGLTLTQAFNILKNQTQKPAVSEVVSKILTDVEGGEALSNALAKYPKIFSPIYISLVQSAEASGLFEKILSRLAENLDKDIQLKAQIKSALLYPAIIVILMIVAVIIMMVFVIPQLNSLYESLDVELPTATKMLVGLSNFTTRYLVVILGVLFLTPVLIRRWYKTINGRYIIDTLTLKMPIFGKLISNKMLTEFTRTLGLLVGSGNAVTASLKQAGNVVGNIIYEHEIYNVSKRVEKGVSVSDAMSTSPIFPPLVVEMAKVGEQTGKLDSNLVQTSEYFERELQQNIKRLTTALEPLIMVILGFGVAFLMYSVITPIYKLTSAF